MKGRIVHDQPADAWQLENEIERAVVLPDEPAIEPTRLLHHGATAPIAPRAGVRLSTARFPEEIEGKPLLIAMPSLPLQAGKVVGVLRTSGNDLLMGLRGSGHEGRSR